MAETKIVHVVLVVNIALSLAMPQQPPPVPPPQPQALPNNAIPHSGIPGAVDTSMAGLANAGNGLGAALDALSGGIFTGIATLFSGMFGSGAISSAFLNYNNRLPVEAL